jgi:NTE family protein
VRRAGKAITALLAALAAAAAPFGALADSPDTPSSATDARLPAIAEALPVARAPGRTCLVLSGGGARGAAHIGVLKVLEQLRVPIDCVVGTSMGAIIGGAWAAGATPAQLEAAIRDANWDVILGDQPDRPLRSLRGKELERERIASGELGLRGSKTLLPGGAVIGQQLEAFFHKVVGPATTRKSFDDLPIPFRAIATDIESGRMVVIDHGSLNAAVRASMSVPGVFSPQEIDGRLLVDGGLVRNLGVDVARSLGATRIIAVSLGTQLAKRDQLNSLFGVSSQMLNILTEQNVAASLALLGPDDVLITPALGDFSSADFGHATATVKLGEQAATAAGAALARLSIPEAAYADYRARLVARQTPVAPTGTVRVDTAGLHSVNPASVVAIFQDATRGRSDETAIGRAVDALYATDDFEQVTVRSVRDGDREDVVVEPREKAWGPNYLRFGLELSTDLQGGSAFTVGADSRRTWLNRRGLEWRSTVTLGEFSTLRSELVQPVDLARRWLGAVFIEGEQRLDDFFVGSDSLGQFRNRVGRAGAEARREFSTSAELAIGVEHSWFDLARVSGLSASNLDTDSNAAYVRFTIDKLDRWDFPRGGFFGRAEFIAADRAPGTRDGYDKALVEIQRAFGAGRHSLSVLLRHGNSLGTQPPVFDGFSLGGFQNLSGFSDRQILANRVSFGRAVYAYQFGESGTVARGFYAGGSAEIADIGQRVNGTNGNGRLLATSLFLAVDTGLGPFYFAAGLGETGERALYLFLGRP